MVVKSNYFSFQNSERKGDWYASQARVVIEFGESASGRKSTRERERKKNKVTDWEWNPKVQNTFLGYTFS